MLSGCVVEDGARITNSYISSGQNLSQGATLENITVLPNGEHMSSKELTLFVDAFKSDTEDIDYDPYKLAEKNESVEGEEPDFKEEI